MVSPSSIAFALHLTGKPMFQSYLFIGLQSCTLFVDSEIEDSSPLHLHLQGIGVTTRKHNDLYDFLREREWGAGKVLVPPKMSHAIAIFLTTPSTPLYTVAPSFVDHLKALEEPMRDSILIWKKHSHRLFESTPGELSASEKVEILRNFAIFARTKLSGLSTGGASTLTEKKDSANATPESDKLLRVVIIQWLQGWVDPTVARGQVKMMKGKVVVEFVETLQNFLDWSKKTDNLSPLFPTPESRQSLAPFLRRCRRCLVSLAKATGELPPSLFVSEGISRPKDPVCIGGFADIFKATYANRSVALKRVRTLARDDRDAKSLRNMFLSETLVWRQLDHPSICPFIGVWREAEIPYMILAWMSNGNAQQYVGDKSISGDVVLQLLIDVADGLVYLHSESVCHGDLCGKNILVDDDGHARLCDFGLSSLFADPRSALYDSNSARLGGTIRWMAPEILSPALGTGMKVTKLTDIYSFGCLGLELYSGRDPHYGTQDRDVIDRVPKGFRPANPGNGRFGRIVPPDVWRMIEQCWQSTPAGRPEASVVLETLKKVQAPTSRPGGVVPQS
ncbi:hypothetical protein JAAARDRAFT_41077 [Jaapia argillacea MUCL 33604]|uniref:Protein kinase domain-containing protein n=1 Tax=Jaapia argillacea MUCL 33604 TaxID=933084 RepID=A0A067PKQ4_9AGAM|nr:hypothetical protein JAAARDRAFT_41077 [Jaapia argillacea MUCL 33604]